MRIKCSPEPYTLVVLLASSRWYNIGATVFTYMLKAAKQPSFTNAATIVSSHRRYRYIKYTVNNPDRRTRVATAATYGSCMIPSMLGIVSIAPDLHWTSSKL